MLQPAQREIIRRSFAEILPIGPVAGALFYSRLFEIAPQTQALFRYPLSSAGMARQGAKLIETLATAVASLEHLDELTPALAALARRHVAYGVEPAHYDAVGAALLWTLHQGLGNRFGPEVEAAWSELYADLSGAMRRAAYPEAAGARG